MTFWDAALVGFLAYSGVRGLWRMSSQGRTTARLEARIADLKSELAAESAARRLGIEEAARLQASINAWNNAQPQKTRQNWRDHSAKFEGTCWRLLDLDPATATQASVRRRYAELAKRAHPDAGGSDALFIKLTNAKNEALRLCRE